MLLHHRNEHLARQIQIRGIKRTAQSARRLDQVVNLSKQCGIIRHNTADLLGQAINLACDKALPVRSVQDNPLAREYLEVVRWRVHRYGLGLAEAQAAGGLSRLQSGVFEGHDPVAVDA